MVRIPKAAIISILLVALLLTVMVGGCQTLTPSSQATSPAATSAAPKPSSSTAAPAVAGVITLKLGSAGVSTSAYGAFAKAWVKEFEKRAAGKAKIQLYLDAALGPTKEYVDMLKTGAIDLSIIAVGATPGQFPLSEVASLPFTVQNIKSGTLALEALQEMDKDVQAELKDMKIITMGVMGLRQLVTVKTPVQTLEDLKGMKIRASDTVAMNTITALGGVGLTFAPSEVYQSLERGVIDGTLTEWSGMAAFKLQEVCKYVTLVNMSTALNVMAINPSTFDKLPPDIQKIINDMSGQFSANLWADTIGQREQEDINNIKAQAPQLKILDITPAEHGRFVKTVTPLYDTWKKALDAKGKPGTKIFDEYKQLLAKY